MKLTAIIGKKKEFYDEQLKYMNCSQIFQTIKTTFKAKTKIVTFVMNICGTCDFGHSPSKTKSEAKGTSQLHNCGVIVRVS